MVIHNYHAREIIPKYYVGQAISIMKTVVYVYLLSRILISHEIQWVISGKNSSLFRQATGDLTELEPAYDKRAEFPHVQSRGI